LELLIDVYALISIPLADSIEHFYTAFGRDFQVPLTLILIFALARPSSWAWSNLDPRTRIVSGFIAFSSEIFWYHLLGFVVETSTYAYG